MIPETVFRYRIPAVALALVFLFLGACKPEKDDGQERIVLNADQKITKRMKGWVGVPPSEPQKAILENQTCVAYRVTTQDIVPSALNEWIAVSPATYKKYTLSELKKWDSKDQEWWTLNPGETIPKDKAGWIGLPKIFPKITQNGDLGLATLHANELIPKEMNGWVCVSAETLEKWARDYEMRKTTIPEK